MRWLLKVAVWLFAFVVGTGAQPPVSADRIEGTWVGEVRCLHGGDDRVTISVGRDATGRLAGSSNWALARSDGRVGPQIPFTTLTVDGGAMAATGAADGHHATLSAVLRDGVLRGEWRVDGVDDTWTFVAMRSTR